MRRASTANFHPRMTNERRGPLDLTLHPDLLFFELREPLLVGVLPIGLDAGLHSRASERQLCRGPGEAR